jgi:hypothetical protein
MPKQTYVRNPKHRVVTPKEKADEQRQANGQEANGQEGQAQESNG